MLKSTYSDEKFLASQIAKGNEEAFVYFFKNYKQNIFRTAYKILRSVSAAEDLTQTLFTNFWRKREQFRDIENLGAYVFGATYKTCLTCLREDGRRSRREALSGIQSIKSGNTTEETIDLRQLISLVHQALHQLPSIKAQVFHLRYYDQESYEDIAATLQIAKGTAQNYFHDAVKQIRKYIDNKEGPRNGKKIMILFLQLYPPIF